MEHSAAFLALVERAKKGVKTVDIGAVKRRLEGGAKFFLIDVREDHEWENGRIPGAIHMGRGILERDIEKRIPQTDREIVLYCGGGFRSALSAESLQKMGYSRVYSMEGGFRAWVEAKGAVEK
ncbi:MAG: sulfurtransferase [Elusimicrobia bacterium]|nr:sulfurtransferase [Elusimicrobiota bacterium]